MIAVALATIAAGGAGAVLRHLVSVAIGRAGSDDGRPRFPGAVLTVNVLGSALGGAVLALGQGSLSPEWELVLLAGVCGGLTTFSTLSVETVQLLQERRAGFAIASVGANLVVGVAACVLAFVAFGGGAPV